MNLQSIKLAAIVTPIFFVFLFGFDSLFSDGNPSTEAVDFDVIKQNLTAAQNANHQFTTRVETTLVGYQSLSQNTDPLSVGEMKDLVRRLRKESDIIVRDGKSFRSSLARYVDTLHRTHEDMTTEAARFQENAPKVKYSSDAPDYYGAANYLNYLGSRAKSQERQMSAFLTEVDATLDYIQCKEVFLRQFDNALSKFPDDGFTADDNVFRNQLRGFVSTYERLRDALHGFRPQLDQDPLEKGAFQTVKYTPPAYPPLKSVKQDDFEVEDAGFYVGLLVTTAGLMVVLSLLLCVITFVPRTTLNAALSKWRSWVQSLQ